MHPVKLGRDKIHHHALNDPSLDQLSAFAVLSVNRAQRQQQTAATASPSDACDCPASTL
jgi:hypothetical protein